MPRQEADYSHRSLFQKLGVKPEHRVALLAIGDERFTDELRGLLLHEPSTALRTTYDMIFLKVDAPVDLLKLERVAAKLKPEGALWIFHPKGKTASPKDGEVRAAGLAAGLVDNKISAYSETHTASRYVVPLASRRAWPRASRTAKR